MSNSKNSSLLLYTAPWLNNMESLESLPDVWGSEKPDNDPILKEAKFKITFSGIVIYPLTYLGLFVVIAGIGFILYIVLAGSHSKILLANSEALTAVTGFGISFLGVVIVVISNVITKKRLILYKDKIVRSRLQTCFDITDYGCGDLTDRGGVFEAFLKSLWIDNSEWKSFKYNDYFRGYYGKLPFLFMDLSLLKPEMKYLGEREYFEDVKTFSGQVVLIELNRSLTDDRHAFMKVNCLDGDERNSKNNVDDFNECNSIMINKLTDLLEDKISLKDKLSANMSSCDSSDEIRKLMTELESAKNANDIKHVECLDRELHERMFTYRLKRCPRCAELQKVYAASSVDNEETWYTSELERLYAEIDNLENDAVMVNGSDNTSRIQDIAFSVSEKKI